MEQQNTFSYTYSAPENQEALSIGVAGCLIFGLGMCLAMEIIGSAMWLGILLGIIGTGVMLLAYPVNRKLYAKAKQAYVPRILELTDELSGEV